MLLDRLLVEPGWAEIYGRWSKAAERRAILEVARRLALPVSTDLRSEVVRTAAAAQMPGGDTLGARSALRRLDGYLAAASGGHKCQRSAARKAGHRSSGEPSAAIGSPPSDHGVSIHQPI